MKKLFLLTKTLLVAVLLMGETISAWGDVTPYSKNYEGDGATCDWTSGNTGRYTTALAENDNNHYVQVSAVGTGESGALITGNSTNGKAASGDNYVLIFDLKITGGNNQLSWFQVNDANNYNASINNEAVPANCMLLLKLKSTNGSEWKINSIDENADQTVTLNKSNWNRVKLIVYSGETYLTITDLSTSKDVFAFAKITTNSTKGGLGGMQFATKRYYSSMAIDNVIVREVEASDLVVATPTFTLGSYNYEEGGYAVTPSCSTEGATLTYKIGSGSATACTSGVPFYAKSGKLNITASKDGWTSSSLATNNQWTLNAAPNSTSPETLIPFQTSNDNGDKNIEHIYKSVTIAGGTSSAVAGIVSGDANRLKLRTNQNDNTITLNVNPGYIVTKVSVNAKSNNKLATIGLSSTTVDGGDNIMAGTTTFPVSTATSAEEYVSGTISAKNNIVFTFDNSEVTGDDDKKNYQIQATIKIWYKTLVESAIEDCKTYETSTEFATAIDAESFSTAAEVYAFHSAWQIVKASASGSTDYSKAIMNKTFELHNLNGWTIYGDASSASGNKEKYGEVEYGDGWSQYYTGWNGRNVSQNIATLPAGTYRLTAKVYSTEGSGATVRLFANGQLSTPEAGGDHDPVLDFTVSGNESSIKIGIGGTGKENDTDNTWGEWWYRVKDFKLTKTGVSTTVGTTGYATFASNYNLDFTPGNGVTGVVAYYASSASDGKVSMTKVTGTVAANTGLFLAKDGDDDVSIPVVVSGTDISESNLLVAADGTEVAAGNYVFAKQGEDYGFYKLGEATVVPVGKAYLKSGSYAARTMSIVFGDDEATGIEMVNGSGLTVDGYYNLNGQRVAQPSKGLYIVNGKKVIMK